MKIQIPLESEGVQLLLTIESKSLITHSKMQHLTGVDIDVIRNDARELLSTIVASIKNPDAPQQ